MRDYQTYLPVDLDNPVNRKHPLAKDLIAWWLCVPGLIGGIKFYDLVNSNHATLINMGRVNNGWVKPNRPGGMGCLEFEGGSSIAGRGHCIASIPNTLTNFTICGWINTTAAILISGNSHLLEGQNFQHLITNIDAFTFKYYSVFSSTVGGVFSFNTPVHLCSTYSPGQVIGYGNGQQISTGTPTVSLVPPLVFGVYKDEVEEYFGGTMDDIRVYNRVLSSQEVYSLYINSKQGYPNLLNRVSFFSNPLGIQQSYFGPTQRGVFSSILNSY
jgi:hypothetical protein